MPGSSSNLGNAKIDLSHVDFHGSTFRTNFPDTGFHEWSNVVIKISEILENPDSVPLGFSCLQYHSNPFTANPDLQNMKLMTYLRTKSTSLKFNISFN